MSSMEEIHQHKRIAAKPNQLSLAIGVLSLAIPILYHVVASKTRLNSVIPCTEVPASSVFTHNSDTSLVVNTTAYAP